VHHPSGAWSDGSTDAAAQSVVAEGIALFAAHGIDATGEIGDANPVYAAETVLRRGQHFDEVLLSTLPPGPSRWLHLDVPARMRKAVTIPVTHLIAERETTS
jgi:hypothetical protein